MSFPSIAKQESEASANNSARAVPASAGSRKAGLARFSRRAAQWAGELLPNDYASIYKCLFFIHITSCIENELKIDLTLSPIVQVLERRYNLAIK
jgi:hypothetical protein